MNEGRDQPSESVRAEFQKMVDREIRHLKELIERTAAEKGAALKLQRKEYLRRLDELNNAHARAEKAVLATVPRETFDLFVENYSRWREDAQAETAAIKASALTRDRIFYIVIALCGLIVSAASIWIALKNK